MNTLHPLKKVRDVAVYGDRTQETLLGDSKRFCEWDISFEIWLNRCLGKQGDLPEKKGKLK